MSKDRPDIEMEVENIDLELLEALLMEGRAMANGLMLAPLEHKTLNEINAGMIVLESCACYMLATLIFNYTQRSGQPMEKALARETRNIKRAYDNMRNNPDKLISHKVEVTDDAEEIDLNSEQMFH